MALSSGAVMGPATAERSRTPGRGASEGEDRAREESLSGGRRLIVATVDQNTCGALLDADEVRAARSAPVVFSSRTSCGRPVSASAGAANERAWTGTQELTIASRRPARRGPESDMETDETSPIFRGGPEPHEPIMPRRYAATETAPSKRPRNRFALGRLLPPIASA